VYDDTPPAQALQRRVERVGFTVDEDAEFLAALPSGTT